MAKVIDVEPVKFFCGVIAHSENLQTEIREDLRKRFGTIDIEAGPLPWDFTDYYEKEMGKGLKKFLFSFIGLRSPDELATLKLATNEIEGKNAAVESAVPRPVNLDPGYINLSSMVLASLKPFAHRVYIGDGVYAQIDYFFRGAEKIEFNPWTYPDYKTEAYLEFFREMRKILLEDIRKEGKSK